MPPNDLAERFLNAFNRIDAHLRSEVSAGKERGFVSVLSEFERRHRGWRPGKDLRALNDLRNVLVHERYAPHAYLAVPTEQVVERIESIRDGLLSPRRVIPAFAGDIFSLRPTDSIEFTLTAVRDHDFSQFPVYDGDPGAGSFRGLLTENGLTRWLAQHVSQEASIVDLEDHTVAEALAIEEAPSVAPDGDRATGGAWANVGFVNRNLPVDDACARFADEPLLEALLVTHHGRATETPLGIVTRWDVLQEGA